MNKFDLRSSGEKKSELIDYSDLKEEGKGWPQATFVVTVETPHLYMSYAPVRARLVFSL